jgi:N-acetylneuraminate synthase
LWIVFNQRKVIVTKIEIGGRLVGDGEPTYIIAEIGINHNGDVDIAKKLIQVAAVAGCTAVKFQKRTPLLAVPEAQRNVVRETPWGTMTYLEYKERTEFWSEQFNEIDKEVRRLDLQWFASPWDLDSVAFLEEYEPPCYKIASASLTDADLLSKVRSMGRPVILSTGMSTMSEIETAVSRLHGIPLALLHATSTYPCPPSELNLNMIGTLRSKFGVPVGYSGHETGLQTTVAAVAIGASIIERHITLDRAMWGSDHAASVEPPGLSRLVRDIRTVESALGDGVKKVYESEIPIRAKLRRSL